MDIAAYILYREGIALEPRDRIYMARIIRHLLSPGVAPQTLALFTPSFNPIGGWGGRYGSEDWLNVTQLLVPGSAVPVDITAAMDAIVYAYSMPEVEYVVYGTGGEPVQYWWLPDEDLIDEGDPVPASRTVFWAGGVLYFGTYSQCVDAGFVACR
jgi:hypothetical protein